MPFVCGYLGTMVRDPELKQTKNGKYTTNFTIASNYGYGEFTGTDFINCIAFSKTAELICKHFSKGSSLIVSGEMHNKPWEKYTRKNGKEADVPNWTFQVNSVTFLPKQKNTNESNNVNQPGFYHDQSDSTNDSDFKIIEEDDGSLPF